MLHQLLVPCLVVVLVVLVVVVVRAALQLQSVLGSLDSWSHCCPTECQP